MERQGAEAAQLTCGFGSSSVREPLLEAALELAYRDPELGSDRVFELGRCVVYGST